MDGQRRIACGRRRVPGLCALAGAVAALALPAAAPAAVISFDDLPATTVVGEQYAALGVHFGPSPFPDQNGTVTVTARPGQAHSAPNVGGLAYDAGTDFSSSWIKFDKQQRKVSFYACRTGAMLDPPFPNVNVIAYDLNGNIVDNQQGIQCNLNGAMVPVTVEKEHVSYLNVYGTQDGWGLDDLDFETEPPAQAPPPLPPPPPTPPAPDFSLNFLEGPLTPAVLALRPGATAKRQIVVGRNETSSGRVQITGDAPPAGVTVSFEPAVVDSDRAQLVTMTVTAAKVAAPVSFTETVHGVPLDAAAGAGPHDVKVPVLVQGQLAVHIEGLEVTQVVQTYLQPESKTYSGVKLVQGKPTVARVFADFHGAEPGGATRPILGMVLYGSRGSTPLPGSPLEPVWSPPSSKLALNDSGLTSAERGSPTSAFVYQLPDSWTQGGPITLQAVAAGPEPATPGFFDRPDTPSSTICLDESCGGTRSWILGGVAFVPTPRRWSISAVSIKTDVLDAMGNVTATQNPLPAAPTFAMLQRISPIPVVFRLTGGYSSDVPVYQAALSARSDVLWEAANAYDAITGRKGDGTFGAFNNQPQNGVTFCSAPNADGSCGAPLRVSVGTSDNGGSGNPSRPLTVIAHEVFHTMGLFHADLPAAGCGGGGIDFPDVNGRMRSVGLDQTPGSGGAGANAPPFRVIDDSTASPTYDLMSYCKVKLGDATNWLSAYNWNKLLGAGAPPALRLPPARAAAPAPGSLRVNAATTAGGTVIARVGSAVGAGLGSAAGSPYSLVARDAAGAVTASVPMRALTSSEPGGAQQLEADVPSGGVAQVDVVSGATVLASRRRSAATPSVTLLAPKAGQRTGSGATVRLAWRASDADGPGGLSVAAEYSADGGRSFHVVASGQGTDAIRLPTGMLPASGSARLRLRVSDGFNEAQSAAVRFVVVPRGPAVTITDPASTVSVNAAAAVYLRGGAIDSSGRAVSGKRLRWFAGRHALGRGRSLSAVLPPGTRSVRLQASDAHGRIGTATVGVRLRSVAPFFLRLSHRATLARSARTFVLKVATTQPATLRVGARRYAVDTHPRRIAVGVRPGGSRLVLRLTLSAGGKRTVQYVVATRR